MSADDLPEMPEEQPESNDSASANEGALPDSIAEVLSEITGGAELPPELLAQLGNAGLAQADPQQLRAMAAQLRSMFAGGEVDGLDLELATRIAREVSLAAGDPSLGEKESELAAQAASISSLWLDAVTDLAAPTVTGRAWSAAEWITETMPVWAEVVEPLADAITEAMATNLVGQFDTDGPSPLPEQLHQLGLPAGMSTSDVLAQVRPMMKRIASSLLSIQIGQAVGTVATEALTGTEVGLPLSTEHAGLLPNAIATFADGLEIPKEEVWLYLMTREQARIRLFTSASWLGPQILAAVKQYASDITVDTDAIHEAMTTADASDPEAIQRALAERLVSPDHSPAQKQALTRLETWLALVEGWVDVITDRATAGHLPSAAALAESVRRRRATAGPAERTMAALVGLELRPRRLRDAANLFAAVEDAHGASVRDEVWSHADLAPTAADLDDVMGYVKKAKSGSDLDAELAKLLDEEG